MTRFNKLTVALVATTALIASNQAALAADRDIGASANFRGAITFTNVVDMAYGMVEYSAAAANNITLDPNGGTITCSNTTDYVCPATGTAGSADINGATGQIVNISCETTGIVSDGTNTIPLNTAKVRINGATSTCAGLGTSPVSYTMVAGADTLKVGALLAIPSAGILADGAYTTALAGGDPVTVRVVYQ
jgi:hypothetical protein